MTDRQHFQLTVLVPRARWRVEGDDVVARAQQTLHEQARQRRLQIVETPVADIQFLPDLTRVRVIVRGEGEPLAGHALAPGPTSPGG